jgi:choline dehydrogenase-like flavoprotein
VPMFSETTDLIIDQARGQAVARCLGDQQALILRNHGIVTAGRVQLLAQAAGGPKLLADGDDLRQKSRRANRIDLHTNVFNYLVRRWKCRHCHQDEACGADPSGHSSRA